MSVTKITNIWCDGRGCYEHLDEPGLSTTDMRKHAKEKGWGVHANGLKVFDLCPTCKEKNDG